VSQRAWGSLTARIEHIVDAAPRGLAAVGRVLAHEIGHFLLRSRNHSPGGLMRSEQMLPELTSLEWHGFLLSAEDAALLSLRADAERKASADCALQK
jgi:hypothetical protein